VAFQRFELSVQEQSELLKPGVVLQFRSDFLFQLEARGKKCR
jgi:hypothetical protein